jgi:glycosyltransferase involved in cell wall biosynthesis
MRIGYVLDRFPSLHQTFVLNEMLALEARGLELAVFSLLPASDLVHADVARLKAPVSYAPPSGSPAGLARGQLDAVAHAPAAWAATVRTVLADPRRVVAASMLRGAALAPAARALGVSHFHAHFAAGANVAAHTLARLTGTSFSFTMHAVDLYARPVLLCETLSAASFGVTSTAYNQQFLAETCGPVIAAKVDLVRACVDPADFAAVEKLPHEVPTILSVGRLIEKKGLRDLVEALAILQRRGLAFRAILVGDGPERPVLAAAIARHGLGEQVSLHGSVTQNELRQLYGRSDLVALPSVVAADGDRDGIPVTLIEALAVGLPVVSTTVSGIPELVTENVGRLVPPHSPAALADALAALLLDPELRARLGQAGPALVRSAFDVSRSAEQMAQLFTDAASRSTHPAADDS